MRRRRPWILTIARIKKIAGTGLVMTPPPLKHDEEDKWWAFRDEVSRPYLVVWPDPAGNGEEAGRRVYRGYRLELWRCPDSVYPALRRVSGRGPDNVVLHPIVQITTGARLAYHPSLLPAPFLLPEVVEFFEKGEK